MLLFRYFESSGASAPWEPFCPSQMFPRNFRNFQEKSRNFSKSQILSRISCARKGKPAANLGLTQPQTSSTPSARGCPDKCTFLRLGVSRGARFVAHILLVFPFRGTHWNSIVSASSQRLKGQSGAMPGAEAFMGLIRVATFRRSYRSAPAPPNSTHPFPTRC